MFTSHLRTASGTGWPQRPCIAFAGRRAWALPVRLHPISLEVAACARAPEVEKGVLGFSARSAGPAPRRSSEETGVVDGAASMLVERCPGEETLDTSRPARTVRAMGVLASGASTPRRLGELNVLFALTTWPVLTRARPAWYLTVQSRVYDVSQLICYLIDVPDRRCALLTACPST